MPAPGTSLETNGLLLPWEAARFKASTAMPMDAYGFSFAIGALKPQPFLYRATCELLGAESGDDIGRPGTDDWRLKKCDR